MIMIKQAEEMTTIDSEGLPDWLEAFNNKETTKKPLDWFASWTPSSTTDNPFKYKIDSGKETNFPVIEVNGPPIKLPSFSISSNQFKVFSDIESRTAQGNIENFRYGCNKCLP